jgi:hypothetical protein
MKLPTTSQQGPGHPGFQKILFSFNGLIVARVGYGDAAAAPFSARRQDLPSSARQNRFG